ncbi:hypothetical protein [Roseateles sp.]
MPSETVIQQFKPTLRSRLALSRAMLLGLIEWVALLRARKPRN